MVWPLQLLDRLAEEEDEETMNLMNELYGPLMQLSLLFPSWKRENVPLTFMCIVLFIFAVCFHFLVLVLSAIKLTDHFDLASLALNYALIFALVLITLIMVNVHRKTFAGIHRKMASDLGRYRTGRIYDEDKPQTLEKNKRKEFLRFLCLPGSIMGLAGLLVVVPYIRKLSKESSKDESHYTASGINMHLPIAMYYPYPTHTGIFHLSAVLSQLVAGAVLAIEVMALEVVFFRVSQAIIFDLRILQYAVDTVFRRAVKLHQIVYPLQKTDSSTIDDVRLQHCIGLCINDSIVHHYNIIQLVQFYEKALKWPAVVAYASGTGMIGLSLINVLDAKEEGNLENLILFLGLTLAEVLNMYILSMFGEAITTESKNLRDILYNIKWYNLNVKNRRTMLNLQTGISEPIIVKAGGLVAICMETFSSIINSSYSFVNLLNAN